MKIWLIIKAVLKAVQFWLDNRRSQNNHEKKISELQNDIWDLDDEINIEMGKLLGAIHNDDDSRYDIDKRLQQLRARRSRLQQRLDNLKGHSSK